MSTDKQNRLNSQIRKLPYSIIRELADLLDDPDDSTMNWKALIKAMPDGTYTQKQVKQFERIGMARGGSSTEALLQDMGHKCKTVKQLVAYLDAIGHIEALELLKPDEMVEIIEHPISQVVQEGKKVEITCRAIGFPPPQFLWLKDGAEFRNGYDRKIVFESVQVKDSGKYTCIVCNPLGTKKTKAAELQVHGTPKCTHPPTIIEHPTSAFIPVGQNYAIFCRAREPCNYQWFKDGFQLHEERFQEIRFSPFKYQDEGNYTCRAFNTEGDALSRIATLQSYTDPEEALRYTCPERKRTGLTQIADDKIALVIGNRDYINLPPGESPLVHTCSDAKTLASILRQKSMGFKVISLINLTHSEINKAIDIFCDLLGENVYGLLYFAGHGFEDRGQNYIVPIDAETDWTPDRAICVQEILLRMHDKGTSFNLFLLDICRKMTNTNEAYQSKIYPFPHDAQVVYGFATSPGHEAYERKSDANGLYMKHLVHSIMKDEKVEDVLSSVAADIEVEVVRDEYVSTMRPQFHSKTARAYSLMDPIRENFQSQERSEKWLQIHKLPQKQVIELEGRGIKLEIRFEHTNWLSNAILVCLRVLDLGDATMCDANLTHLPKDFQECHFHPSTTNQLRHVVPPETVARTWKIDDPRERTAPVPVESISEIYNIQRLKKNLTLTIELKYVMKGSREEQTKYEIKAFNLKEFGIAHVFS